MEYGLVLGGGGTRGSYEIGVWKALMELNIKIKAVAGTSVGALNGAMIIQGDYETAYDLWTNIDIQSVIKLGNLNLCDEKRLSFRDTVSYLKHFWHNGGLDITPLKQMLNKYIDENIIRKSPIDFGLVTFSLSDFKPVILYKKDIPEGKLVQYLIASASLPIFKQQFIENKIFIDGGIYDNIPVSMIFDRGIKNIIVVDCSGYGRTRKIFFKNAETLYIKNSEHLGGTLDFNDKTARSNIKIGYLDTMKAFKKVKGKKYFITSDKNTYLNLVSPLTKDALDLMLSLLDINQNSPSDKFISYRIIRTIKDYLSDSLDADTSILAAAEITAEVFGLEKLKIYTLEELAYRILKEYYSIKNNELLKNPLASIRKMVPDNINHLKLADRKYLAGIGVGINKNPHTILYRKFLATTLPKICVANLFISLMIYRKQDSI